MIDTLQSPSPQAGLYSFGWAVATDGDIAVISEPTADVSGASNEGKAYVYFILQPVGGEVAPVSVLSLMAPWIALATAAITIGFTITRRKLFLH